MRSFARHAALVLTLGIALSGCAPRASAPAVSAEPALFQTDQAGAIATADDFRDATAAPASTAPSGSGRVEARTLWSASLGRAMPYRIYLPPGYDSDPARMYSALYLLHGLGGNETEWIEYGATRTADRMINSGQIAPLVIVMPSGEQAYWVDHADGVKWGTYTAVDVVNAIESTFRVQADRAHRAIGGLSMGAHGALQLALNFPNRFAAVGSHSLVLRRYDTAPRYFGNAAQWAERDPMQLVYPKADVVRTLKLWMDIGSQDPWAPLARQFEHELVGLHVEHQWHEWQGDHSSAYWGAHLPDYLHFYDAALSN